MFDYHLRRWGGRALGAACFLAAAFFLLVWYVCWGFNPDWADGVNIVFGLPWSLPLWVTAPKPESALVRWSGRDEFYFLWYGSAVALNAGLIAFVGWRFRSAAMAVKPPEAPR